MRNRDPRPSARPTSARRPRRASSPRRTPGQALVETAIGIVLLVLLSLSVVEAAMLFFAYLTLQNGVTAATRFGVTGQDPNDDDHPTRHEDSIKRVMRDATGLTLEDGEFTFYDITTQSSGTGGPDDIIQVTVKHPLQLISPMVWPLVGNGGVITLSVSATMRNEPSPNG